MRSHVQFINTPTADTPGTGLILHFDNKRYFVGNIAEGTQRAFVQQGTRLLKVSDLLLTGRTEWSNVGGLIGMILTLADAISSSAASSAEDKRNNTLTKGKEQGSKGDTKDAKEKPKLRIYGAGNLNYVLATARRFVFRKGMPIDIHEMTDEHVTTGSRDPTWSDDNIKVWALPITPHTQATTPSNIKTGSASPRKRNFDEFNAEPAPTTQEKISMIAKAVVSQMFNSTWRLDALVEVPINEVQLPAALFVKDPVTGKTVKYTGPMPGGSEPVPDITVLVRRPWPGALIECLPPTKPAKESISYIIRYHRQRGKFRPERAMELGVAKGPNWAALSGNQSVQNDKGETITPDMVLEEGKDGSGVAVVDLPSLDYVENLVNRPEWTDQEVAGGIGAFVWILGPGVAESPLLQDFISERKHLQHIVSSRDICPNRLSLDSAAESTIKLMQVDPARYNVPVHDSPLDPKELETKKPGIFSSAITAERGLKVQLEPSVEVQHDQIPPLLDVEAVKSSLSPEVVEAARKAQEDIVQDKASLDDWASRVPTNDAEIITLGTGSAIPSKYRNVSATLVRVPGWGSVLLDCGENTLGQLKRVYTPDELLGVLDDLRMIWISHMHADHHLGTVSVIRAWYEAVHGAKPVATPQPSVGFVPEIQFINQKRLSVVSEVGMLKWLEEYSSVEDYGHSRVAPLIISHAEPLRGIASRLTWFKSPLTENYYSDKPVDVPAAAIGLTDIQAVGVTHCVGSRAVSITMPSGFKVSYSGDCRPSRRFAEIGKGSTVCIHEATFDDELQGDAMAKRHSTTSEALSVALGMGAKACVLTHFSQRYQKVPVLEYTDSDDAIPSLVEAQEDDDEPMTDAGAAATTSALAEADSAPVGETKQTTIKLKAGTEMKVCVAFDLMKVKVGEMAQMEKLTPVLVALFADEEKSQVTQEAGDGGSKNQQKGKASKKEKAGKSKRNN